MTARANHPHDDFADIARAAQLAGQGDLYFSQARFPEALQCFQAARMAQASSGGYAYRVGLTFLRLGMQESACGEFQAALRLDPAFAQAHAELARAQLLLGRMVEALAHARRAVELQPDDSTLWVTLASVLQADGQADEAMDIVDRLLESGFESTDLAMVFAGLATKVGSVREALALIDRLLQKSPPPTPREQSALHFAAAGLLDYGLEFARAFVHASAGNSLRAAAYDPAQTARSFQNFIDYFTREKIARLPHARQETSLPVFIVGMPRSGTSLVEQILASHPAVHGAGELTWIAESFEAAVGRGARGSPPTLQSLDGLSPGDVEALSGGYLSRLVGLDPAARHITDKMPTNFIYLGLIAILFPAARIIHCRRDAMDTCLSCFMTDFAAGYEFSFGLETTGHFYRQYSRMMSHWKSVLDLPMLEVDYEKLVEDVEGESRRMVAFLNLPWDENCLRFHDSPRFVGTASHAQVRRPVYRSSVNRWRNYERFLEPLRKALEGV